MTPGKTSVRDLIAFWIFGLANNYAYVIMLSAAEDIIAKQEGISSSSVNSSRFFCEETITKISCHSISTGAILLADILPCLFVKATFPFFMHRIPFGLRHLVVCLFQTASFILVAFSKNFTQALIGITFTSFGSGLGEICYLSLAAHYEPNTIMAWSSGTGAAGIIGAIAYAVLTEPHFANLSARIALLIMIIVPFIFAAAYWFLLTPSPSIHRMHLLDYHTWIVPTRTSNLERTFSKIQPLNLKDSPRKNSQNNITKSDQSFNVITKQKNITFTEKIRLIIPLLKYMIPYGVVYFSEYLINQGLTELIYFDCSHGFSLARPSQYRWYQVLYQIGVFISRSSVNFIELSAISLYFLPVLQSMNVIIFFFNAIYRFIPHISIIFVFILFEGFFGGAVYVNTFNRIHKEAASEVREFSLSVASMADSFGIVASGLLSIPIHNYICSLF